MGRLFLSVRLFCSLAVYNFTVITDVRPDILSLPPYDDIFICKINARRIPSSSNFSVAANLLLLLAGDVAPNPGPQFSCAICQNRLDGRAKPIHCSVCSSQVHSTCTGLKGTQLGLIRSGKQPYYCTENCANFDRFVPELLTGFDLSFEHNSPQLQPVLEPKIPPHGNVLIGSANVNSLRGKFLQLYALISTYDYAAFCLQETKLGNSIKENFDIPGYTLFRRDRNENGGGVAIYCKSDYFPTQLRSHNDSELIAVQMTSSKGTFIIASVYQPPNQSQQNEELFSDSLSNFLAGLGNRCSELILMGDLNWDSVNEVGKLNQFTHPFALRQLVDTPTHHNRSIDLLFNTNNLTWGLGAPLENHHAEVWCHVPTQPRQPQNIKRSVWLYKSVDWDAFSDAVLQLDLNSIVSLAENVNDAWEKWKNAFLNLVEHYIPRKMVPVKRAGKNWFNRSIKRLIRQRDSAYRQFRTNQTPQTAAKHKRLQKKVKKAVYAAKKSFYTEQFGNCKDPASYWKAIKHVTGQLSKSYIPDLYTDHGHAITDSAKANVLADQYDSVFNRADAPLPSVTNHHVDADWLCEEDWVYDQLRSLDTKKSCGTDGISAKILYESAAVISPSISLLINRSITEGCVPSEWSAVVENPQKCQPPRIPSIACEVLVLQSCCFNLTLHY